MFEIELIYMKMDLALNIAVEYTDCFSAEE